MADQLVWPKGVGPKALRHLAEALAEQGLAFAPNTTNLSAP